MGVLLCSERGKEKTNVGGGGSHFTTVSPNFFYKKQSSNSSSSRRKLLAPGQPKRAEIKPFSFKEED